MNELTREGVSHLEAGDIFEARKSFVESLRHNSGDTETWFWLATTFDDKALRAQCLRFVLQVNPTNEIAQKGLVYLAQKPGDIEGKDGEYPNPIEIPVAGVEHRNRQEIARDLMINQTVVLRREPHNPYDEDAIQIETLDGRQFGFVPRKIAGVLSSFIDRSQKLFPAKVTGLTSGYHDYQSISVKITFFVPDYLELPLGSYEKLEYSYDDSGSYAYVLVNCNEHVLDSIKSKLENIGVKVQHSGVSSRPAADGHLYQWFIRIANPGGEDTETVIDRLFESEYGVLSTETKVKRLTEEILALDAALEQAEAEKRDLEDESLDYLYESDDLKDKMAQKDAQIEMLKFQVEKTQYALDSQRRIKKIRELSSSEPFKETEKIITLLLPKIDFLRDSLQILLHEVQGYEKALKLLREICYSPETVRAENFECAQGYKELRFGDGRIYFNSSDDEKIKVLVSTKTHQREDERYLKR